MAGIRGFPTDLVVVQPSLISDGNVNGTGGLVEDQVFGSAASVTIPPGAVSQNTSVAIDVFQDPLDVATPTGYEGPGTLLVNIEFSPAPVFPLPTPGLTVVLPLSNPLPPGTSLDLFRVEPSTGNLVPALDVLGLPVVGTVDAPAGLSATFVGIASLSTVVGLIPIEQTPQQKIQALIASVNSLVTAGKLKSAQGRVLTSTLQLALRYLDQGKTKLAVLLLKGFVVEVKLLVRIKRLASTDGQPLIDAAETIVAQLE